jgi:REP element-mobilizing transposase RayT
VRGVTESVATIRYGETMPHSLTRSLFHIVFSTKERRNLIPQSSLENAWAYIAGIGRNHKMTMLAVGGIQNHVHVLLELPPEVALADAVRTLKCNSSRWIREGSVRLFEWQQGYWAFSVSPSQVGGVLRYIAHQREHHSRYSFDAELHSMISAAGIRSYVAPEGARET